VADEGKPALEKDRLGVRKAVKRIRVVAERENPGVLEEITFEAVPCKEYRWDERRWQRNPNRQVLWRATRPFERAELWVYTDLPGRVFFSVGDEWISVDSLELKPLFNAIKSLLSDPIFRNSPVPGWLDKKRFFKYNRRRLHSTTLSESGQNKP